MGGSNCAYPLYCTLHAQDYDDPNDERLAAMWRLVGSFLFRGSILILIQGGGPVPQI